MTRIGEPPNYRSQSSYSGVELNQQLLARHMLLSGYVTYIVQLETGLQPKKVRHIMKTLVQEGFPDQKRSRASRSSKTLIRNQRTKLHASLLMQLYKKFGGDDIMNSVNIPALTRAFRAYVSVLKDQPAEYRIIPVTDHFEISDAWFLARELRTKEAMFDLCNECGCNYFTAVNQGTRLECPFCHDPKASLTQAVRTAPTQDCS